MKIVAIANQSLFDIANQEFGSIDAAFHIARSNGMAVTDLPTPGQVIELPDMIFDKGIADYFKNNQIRIATVTTLNTETEDYALCGELPYSL